MGSTNKSLVDIFLYSHYLSVRNCIDIVRRNFVFVTHDNNLSFTCRLALVTLTFLMLVQQTLVIWISHLVMNLPYRLLQHQLVPSQ